jgi:O-antigen/teichoic acid export membrane protein
VLAETHNLAANKILVDLWWRRLRILGGVAFLQVVVQLINALTGVIIVRTLDKSEYALFTVAGSMLALMSGLSDSGAQTGLLSVGGKHHSDHRRLSRLVATALRLRFALTAVSLALVGPMTWYLLVQNQASRWDAQLLLVSVVAGSFLSTSSGVLLVPLRLVGEYTRVQLSELANASSRLLLSAVAVAILPVAVLCTISSVIASWIQNFALRWSAQRALDLAAKPSAEDHQVLMSAVRLLWFPTVFSAFQAQIAIWIMGLFGTPSDVADIGALGRFSALFTVLVTVITVTVAPTFARCQQRDQLVLLLLQAGTALGAACGMLTFFAFVLPNPFLWVLGSSYAQLSTELGLFFIANSLGVITMLLWAFVSSKMWVKYIWTIPPATLLVQCLLPLLMDVSTIRGVIGFMICSSLVPLAITAGMATNGLRRMSHHSQCCPP